MRFFRSFALFTVLIVASSLSIWSCKSDGNTTTGPSDKTVDFKKAYTDNPSAATANAVISDILNQLKGDVGTAKRAKMLEYGYQVATEQGINARAAGFLFPMLKEAPRHPNADQLFNLGQLMKKLNKESASNTLFKGLQDNHAGFAKLEEAKAAMTTPISDINVYIKTLGEQLFQEVDNTGINRDAAMSYVDACEAFALAYPNNKDAADNLFKAAEVAKSIRTFPKSLSIYDWIIDKYPDYEKAPTSLFLKGFIIENNLNDDEKAKDIYNKFLQKYPKHDLADDVKFLIDNLGKTDQEILQMIEDKQKEKQK